MGRKGHTLPAGFSNQTIIREVMVISNPSSSPTLETFRDHFIFTKLTDLLTM